MTDQGKDAATVLLEGEMKDWRIAEGEGEELTARQREAWTYKIVSGPFDGLTIDFVGPDGTTRSVSLEVDRGNIKATTFGIADEAHAILQIGKDETVVEAMTPQVGLHAQGVRFGANGLVMGNTHLEPGCTDDTPDLKP